MAKASMLPRFIDWPKPLFSCPGLPIWMSYRGQKYLVFVDESFFMFFDDEMTAKTGYFCHAAVGIPESEYGNLRIGVAPILKDFQDTTGQGLSEFKHSAFKRLALKDRKRMAMGLRRVMQPAGAFVAGFYTPVRSYILEHVRTILLGEAEAVPDDYGALYERAVRELKDGRKGPGDSGMVSALLQLPVGGVANMLATLECPFEVVYDPRGTKEDRAVRANTGDYMAIMDNLKKIPMVDLRTDLNDYYRGFRHDKSSEEELGLQLADLFAGEVVAFFKANQELMTYAANERLVTQTSKEALSTISTIGPERLVFKTGTLFEMPSRIRRCFKREDAAGLSVLSYFRELFAAGMLTCYSSWGQPRDVMPFEGWIWDQID